MKINELASRTVYMETANALHKEAIKALKLIKHDSYPRQKENRELLNLARGLLDNAESIACQPWPDTLRDQVESDVLMDAIDDMDDLGIGADFPPDKTNTDKPRIQWRRHSNGSKRERVLLSISI